jgi:phospholipid transport system substrate-binding protein
MRVSLAQLLLVVGIVLGAGPASASDMGTPKAVIESFYAQLVDVMRRGPTLGFAGREKVLRSVLSETYDLDYVARLVLGRSTRTLDDTQLSDFEQVFSDMVVATYASRFDNYEQERFVTLGQRSLKHGRTLVETVVEGTSMGNVRLNYVMHERDGVWRIINVVSQGVSDISLKRSEYRSVMGKEGFDSLLDKIRQQTKKLAKRA